MKKLLLALSFIFSLKAQSQSLVLTQAFNEPVVGDTNFTYPADTSAFTTGLPMSVTGSYATWDFTRLGVFSSTAIPSVYLSAASVSNSINYAGCTMVSKQGTSYTYYKSTTTPTTQTEVLGISTSTISFTFTNTAVTAKYPMSFNTSVNDNLSGTFVFSVTGTCTGSVNSVADGYGNLFLPNGVYFSDVLRVKSIQTLSLSAALVTGLPPSQVGTIRQTTYNYFHSSQKFPLLTVDYTKLSLITSSTPTIITVVSANSKSFLVGFSQNTLDKTTITVAPNPTKDFFSISVSNEKNEACSVEIYSIVGALIKKTDLGKETFINQKIDISSLDKGIYILKTNVNSRSLSQRLVIE